jgi:hypothetical protein
MSKPQYQPIDIDHNYEERRKPWENPQAATLENLRLALEEFSKKTFPARTIQSVNCHLKEELDELMAKPDDIEEHADVLILYLQIFSMAFPGKNAFDLLQAAWAKLEKNKSRKWLPPDADGVVRHVK